MAVSIEVPAHQATGEKKSGDTRVDDDNAYTRRLDELFASNEGM
jgi:hypothetical protein